MMLTRRSLFISALLLGLCLMSSVGWAGAKPAADANSPEGRLLEKVQAESDLSKRLALLELFPDLFPTSTSLEYVWTELQARYHQAGKLEKALNAGSNALIRNPESLEVACLNWRIAADLKNPTLTSIWMKQAGYVADRVLSKPDPERTKATIECGASARQANENEAYNAAISTKNPADRVKLLEEFLKNHADSKHAEDIEIAVFMAYREQGDSAKALAAAEKLVTHNETREDAMLLVAEAHFKAGNSPNLVVSLSRKAIERLNSAEKPENMAQADWARSRSAALAQANYMIGSVSFQAEKWDAADQAFRAALPNLTDNRFRAEVLNSLGWANYKLKNVSDSIKFYIDCTNIPGPLQQAAAKTLNTITAEYRIK